MRIIIAGTRTFEDFRLMEKTLNKLTAKLKKITIISGGDGRTGDKGQIVGADALGEWWAYLYHHTVEVFHADWKQHGKKAGPIRNSEMVESADALVAFWDGESPGTKDVIDKARKAKLKVKVVNYKES